VVPRRYGDSLLEQTRNVNYAAWAAANPVSACEAKGGCDGVTWVTETEAQARTARFANTGGQTAEVSFVTCANEAAEQMQTYCGGTAACAAV
jgi:hypothetical protein